MIFARISKGTQLVLMAWLVVYIRCDSLYRMIIVITTHQLSRRISSKFNFCNFICNHYAILQYVYAVIIFFFKFISFYSWNTKLSCINWFQFNPRKSIEVSPPVRHRIPFRFLIHNDHKFQLVWAKFTILRFLYVWIQQKIR